MLPEIPLREELTWSEAGVDSLRSLHLLLLLEQRLDTRISFDLFARDLKIGDFIRGLARAADATSPDAPLGTLFLVPGVYGDEPRLADFRRAIGGQIRSETLELPELDQPTAVLSDIGAMAARMVGEIQRLQPHGAVAVAGYSFGGLVAYQVTADLQAAGREVALLCLLDAPPIGLSNRAEAQVAEPDPPPALRHQLGRFSRRPGESVGLYLDRFAYRLLMATGQHGAARRLVLRNWPKYDFARRHMCRRALLGVYRWRAMRGWRPAPCAAPTLLITSDPSERMGSGAWWARQCAQLTVQPVGGDHESIFDPEPLTHLVPALYRAMQSPPAAVAA